MKTLKKIIPFILLASTATMSGCSMYSSKADTLENIVGFYELEIWKGKHEASDEDPYDRKAEEGTVAYFTIDKDGYAYRDDHVETDRGSAACCEDRGRRPRTETLGGTSPAHTRISDVQPPGLGEAVCSLSQPICGICYRNLG